MLESWAKDGVMLPASRAGALFLFALTSSVVGWFEVRHAQIVPYFRESVEGPFTLRNGASLSQNCRRLDALAEAKGCRSLFSFGFADELAGEAVTWHPASEGLKKQRDSARLPQRVSSRQSLSRSRGDRKGVS